MINRFDIVVEKLSGKKMMISEIINRGEPDEYYNAKYLDNNGEFRFIYVEKDEFNLSDGEKTVGFKNGK